MTTRTYGAKDTGGFYFQSDTAQAQSTRRAEKAKGNAGQPLKLNAKLSAVLKDNRDEGVVFVADNGGGVRRVELKTNKTTHTYRGPRQPVTSICTDPSGTTLFAGCWDKTIWSWDVSTGAQRKRYVGHNDFVNCVTTCYISTSPSSENLSEKCLLLISGSVDATINVWQVETGGKLHTLKGHSRGILDLAIDPLSTLINPSLPCPETIYLLSASSTPEIRSWRISLASASEITTTLSALAESDDSGSSEENVSHATESAPFTLHDTSVNKILFSSSPDSAVPSEYDLYTASSDNTSKILARPPPPPTQSTSTTQSETAAKSQTTTNPPQWTTTSTFAHPDWVRAIAHDSASGSLVTACRDEEVRVWDTNEGKCVKVLTGHFDSVEGVTLVELPNKDGMKEMWIISVSLDGTLRRWRLEGEAEADGTGKEAVEDTSTVEASDAKSKVITTEDEDRELAELMAELEDDD